MNRDLVIAASADLAEAFAVGGICLMLGIAIGAVGTVYVWLGKKAPR